MTHTWTLTSWMDPRMVQAEDEVVSLEAEGDHLVLDQCKNLTHYYFITLQITLKC